MFNFLKAGIEFNKLAEAMNGMNVMIQELIPKIKNSLDKDEHAEDVLVLAYLGRVGIWDRIEKYNWTMDVKIVVPTIDRRRITLAYALMQTVGKVSLLAAEFELEETIQEIFEKGPAFQQIERIIPENIRKTI